ncbi:MAG TPA: hypothetical protein VF077_03995 [Nitrospiraceae bacterium]
MMKDFSSVLGTSKDKLSELIGVFKTLYDGNYNRAIGTDGGRKLAWKGKVMMLSACTNSIDDYHTMMAQMGERWVYFRYPESEGWQEALQAMRNREYDDGKESLSDIVKAFFDGQGIAFGPEGDESRGARALKYGEEARLIAMAGFLARSRGVVRRDDRTREIISLPTREMPARLAVIFQYMYLGMELIGMDDARERWKVIGKAVMDSMPLIRRRVIGIVEQRSGKGGATYKQIQDELVVSDSLVRRTVEDLESLGVLEVNKLFKHSVWLTPEAGKMRAEGWV